MTAKDFRRIALSLPEAIEGEHMGHPDFRVRGKIFATLYPDESWGVVMLTPGQQATLVESDPITFVPAKGAWGRRGCTQVLLKTAKASVMRDTVKNAWRNKAPRQLLAHVEEETSR